MFDSFEGFFSHRKQKQEKSKFSGNTPRLNGPALENQMLRLAETSPECRYPLLVEFYQTLLESIVLTPIPSGSSVQAIEEHGVPLMVMANDQEDRGVLIFTSESAMSAWVERPTEYVGVPFSALCTHAVANELDFLVINVAGPSGGEIGHFEMTYLAEGLIPPPNTGSHTGEVTLEKDTEIHLAALETTPGMLLERLCGVCSQKQAQVERVYLFKVAFSNGPFKTAIGVRVFDGHENDWETAIWPDMQAMLQEVLGTKEYVNVFLLNQSGDLETTLTQVTAPVFSAA